VSNPPPLKADFFDIGNPAGPAGFLDAVGIVTIPGVRIANPDAERSITTPRSAWACRYTSASISETIR
jgi:hypothetical protein